MAPLWILAVLPPLLQLRLLLFSLLLLLLLRE